MRAALLVAILLVTLACGEGRIDAQHALDLALDRLMLRGGDVVDIYSIIPLEMSEFAEMYDQDYDLESSDQEVWLVTFTGGITWSDWGDFGYGSPVRTSRYIHIAVVLDAMTGDHITTLGHR